MYAYVEHFEEVGEAKMSFRIIVLIVNDYFTDKKHSGPIVSERLCQKRISLKS